MSEKVEEHLQLKDELKKEILNSANEIKNKKVKTLKFDELYEKLYGHEH